MSNARQDLFVACAEGDLETVKRVLPKVRLYSTVNRALHIASREGQLAVVNHVLKDPRCDPSSSELKALTEASFNGHQAICDRLMQESRILAALEKIEPPAVRHRSQSLGRS